MNALSFLEVALICRTERRKSEETVLILTLLFRMRAGVQGLGIYLLLPQRVQTMGYLGSSLVCKWQKIRKDSGSTRLGVVILLLSGEAQVSCQLTHSATPESWPLFSRSQRCPEHSGQQDKRKGLRRKGQRAYATFLLRKHSRNYQRIHSLASHVVTPKLQRMLGNAACILGS